MITDTEIKINGVQSLTKSLGSVGAERFIALIQREQFDYTKWQRTLWEDQSIEEISRTAMKIYENIAEQLSQPDREKSGGDMRSKLIAAVV
ncbi:hypothetical protein KKG56_09385 [bacterium]|nr:hypothetical protein [bacterium]